MFKYCVWYTFKNSAFNTIVSRNANMFNTYKYTAHITIKSGIGDLNEANMVADRYRAIHPTFVPYGKPKQSHVKLMFGIQLIDFYAIEQPLKVNGHETDVHVSLAYKNEPFTDMELAVANANIPKSIDPSDLDICVMNCYCDKPAGWFKARTLT